MLDSCTCRLEQFYVIYLEGAALQRSTAQHIVACSAEAARQMLNYPLRRRVHTCMTNMYDI